LLRALKSMNLHTPKVTERGQCQRVKVAYPAFGKTNKGIMGEGGEKC
jgi:hypothetical protein